jgi:hypothetical protein
MRKRTAAGAVLWLGLFLAGASAQQNDKASPVFRIKYVAEGVVYLNAGRNAGLTEHQILKVVPPETAEGASRGEQLSAGEIASIEVISLADASAVCEVRSSARALVAGDVVLIPGGAQRAAPAPEAADAPRPYLQVISFTTDEDPLDEEIRDARPHPPLPEVNRMRGRIGLEYNAVMGRGVVGTTNQDVGLVLRGSATRIGGSYWNFSGYWRGRLTQRSGTQPQTISDLINRTYQISMTYNNPYSLMVAGVGRMYLPWASSLDAIDGGYAGVRTTNGLISGIFAGTTPDPASWDYNPDRRIAGAFVNVERGKFEGTHFTGTTGVAIAAIGWKAERQFLFSETTMTVRRKVSLYHSMQVDATHTYQAPNPLNPAAPLVTQYGGLNRSYASLRLQPVPRLSFDLSHSYFSSPPTVNPVLIGSGLLDRYLFQGLSGGVRAEVLKQVTLYTSLGRNSRSGDTGASWNQLYGITFGNLLRTGWRTDLRYTKFDSVFGQGEYEALSISKQVRESLRLEFQGGLQRLNSPVNGMSSSHFAISQVEWSPGRHLFMQSSFTWQRGGMMNYDQVSFVIGERF